MTSMTVSVPPVWIDMLNSNASRHVDGRVWHTADVGLRCMYCTGLSSAPLSPLNACFIFLEVGRSRP